MKRLGFISSALVISIAACVGSSNTDDGTSSSSSSSSGGGNATTDATTSTSSSPTTSSTGGSGGAGAAGAGGNATGGSGGIGGDFGSEVRLIAIGDTGEGNDDQHCVGWAMSAKCQQDGCDGVLLAGDNFYDEGVTDVDDFQWVQKFEEPYDKPGLAGLPFYAVLGNHDYSPQALQLILDHDGNKDAQIQYTSLPVGTGTGERLSDKWTMPAPYYDVVLGGGTLHLFGLDGQDASQSQLDDMSGRVSASTSRWKLVFNHFPRFTSGDHQDDMGYLNFLLGLAGPDLYTLLQGVYCYSDIFLAGHDHDREYMSAGQDPSCPNTHFIVSGAGAKNDDVEHNTESHQQYFNNEIEGFFYLVFQENQIIVESYDKIAMANTREEADCAPAGLDAPAYSTTITK